MLKVYCIAPRMKKMCVLFDVGLLYWPVRPIRACLLAQVLQTDCNQKFVRSDFTQVESIGARDDFIRASL